MTVPLKTGFLNSRREAFRKIRFLKFHGAGRSVKSDFWKFTVSDPAESGFWNFTVSGIP